MTDGFVVADLLFVSSNICVALAAGASVRQDHAVPLPYSTGNTERSGISVDKQNLVCNGTKERGWGIRIWPYN